MKITFGKNNSDVFSNYNEPDLRMLFPILDEIKDTQSQIVQKNQSDHLDTLFDIITHVSLLHNQIFHLAYTELDKRQCDHILQLNKFNLEKSIRDFFTAFTKKLDKGKEKEQDKPIMIQQQAKKTNRSNVASEHFRNKEKDFLTIKHHKENSIDKKQYLSVNRSLRCNSQVNIKQANETSYCNSNNSKSKTPNSPSIYLNNNNSKSNSNNNTHANEVKQYSALYPNSEKKTMPNPLFDSNKKLPSKHTTLTDLNLSGKPYESKHLYEYKSQMPKNRSKLYLTCKSYKSFDKSKDFRDITKPSNYTKYLLEKYKHVVETYGDELRSSLNNSMKRAKSSNKKASTSQSFENSPNKSRDESRRQNSSNSFIKITKKSPYHYDKES